MLFHILRVWSTSRKCRNRRLDHQQSDLSMSRLDPFQELVDNLRRVLTATPPPAPATTSVSTIASPPSPLIASTMASPTPFSGVAEECNGFLLQCSLNIEMQPHLYTTERSKVSFLISLLSSKALQWAEMIWAQAGDITQSFDNFCFSFQRSLWTATQ